MSGTGTQLPRHIWSLTDLLRGDFKTTEYGSVVLPLTVLRLRPLANSYGAPPNGQGSGLLTSTDGRAGGDCLAPCRQGVGECGVEEAA